MSGDRAPTQLYKHSTHPPLIPPEGTTEAGSSVQAPAADPAAHPASSPSGSPATSDSGPGSPSDAQPSAATTRLVPGAQSDERDGIVKLAALLYQQRNADVARLKKEQQYLAAQRRWLAKELERGKSMMALLPPLAKQQQEEGLAPDEYPCGHRACMRELQQAYADMFKFESVADLHSALEADSEVKRKFEQQLEADGADWQSWEEGCKWYQLRDDSIVSGPGEYPGGRPVGMSRDAWCKIMNAWDEQCAITELMRWA